MAKHREFVYDDHLTTSVAICATEKYWVWHSDASLHAILSESCTVQYLLLSIDYRISEGCHFRDVIEVIPDLNIIFQEAMDKGLQTFFK
jgi:hypothetical protein